MSDEGPRGLTIDLAFSPLTISHYLQPDSTTSVTSQIYIYSKLFATPSLSTNSSIVCGKPNQSAVFSLTAAGANQRGDRQPAAT